jgi:hypothetical protein
MNLNKADRCSLANVVMIENVVERALGQATRQCERQPKPAEKEEAVRRVLRKMTKTRKEKSRG